jgi:hypothetical protein
MHYFTLSSRFSLQERVWHTFGRDSSRTPARAGLATALLLVSRSVHGKLQYNTLDKHRFLPQISIVFIHNHRIIYHSTLHNQLYLVSLVCTTCPVLDTANLTTCMGRTIAQAVSRRLPTAAAHVRSQVGFLIDKIALGQVFSEYFGFPCQSAFHLLLHTHHLSSGAGTRGQ